MDREANLSTMTVLEQELKVLFEASIDGSVLAYRTFLTRLTPFVRRYLRRHLSSALSEVEDLTQEILWALHRQRHTYDPRYPLTSWVHGIARYKLIDHYRSKARMPEFVGLDSMEEVLFEPDDPGADDRQAVAVMLQDLPAKQRSVIELVKLQGHSIKEASRLTGQSESAVKVNIHRGLKRISLKWARASG